MLTAERNRLRSGCRFDDVKFQTEGNIFTENIQMPNPLFFFLLEFKSTNSIIFCPKVPSSSFKAV